MSSFCRSFVFAIAYLCEVDLCLYHLNRNSLSSGGDLGDLEAWLGGFALEGVDLPLAMSRLVELASLIDELLPITKHAIYQSFVKTLLGFEIKT